MNSDDSDLLRFENVTVGYSRKRILENLNFEIEAGDYLAIVGSNGSGKTTVLRTLLGLLPPVSGEIHRASGGVRFGYVPQSQSVDEVFPLTVPEVVVMGLYGRIGLVRRPAKADWDKARAAMEEVGIGHLGDRLFRELSGGQKQRALVARAMVSDPHILVLDEHTNNLDIVGERSIMELVDQVHARHNMAVVMVTHSLNTVANHARHIGIIRSGRFEWLRVDEVMQTEYLCELYGWPVKVMEVDGRRVII